MTKIEMAISAIEIALEQNPPADIEQGYRFYLVIEDALATAMDALREKQARSGCEHCQQAEEMAYEQDGMKRDAYIYLDESLLVADLYSESMAVAVCYCPMCGRRLEGNTCLV